MMFSPYFLIETKRIIISKNRIKINGTKSKKNVGSERANVTPNIRIFPVIKPKSSKEAISQSLPSLIEAIPLFFKLNPILTEDKPKIKERIIINTNGSTKTESAGEDCRLSTIIPKQHTTKYNTAAENQKKVASL
jgi:hypothetical protein